MKKWMFLAGVVLLAAALIVGCGQGGVADDDEPQGEEPEGSYPQRIVSLLPSNTEILFALGLDERVVGVTDWCNYPAEAEKVEKIGDAFNLNLEKIVSLNPDLVVTGIGAVMDEAAAFLEEKGIETVAVNPVSVAETLEEILYLGEITGKESKAEAITAEMQAVLDAIEEKTAALDESDKPRVFVLIDPEYLYTVGAGEFLHELVELAGGINIAADLGEGYFVISEEAVVEQDPDLILSTFYVLDAIQARDAWSELRAVKEENVFVVTGDWVSRQSPRLTLGIQELYDVFYNQ